MRIPASVDAIYGEESRNTPGHTVVRAVAIHEVVEGIILRGWFLKERSRPECPRGCGIGSGKYALRIQTLWEGSMVRLEEVFRRNREWVERTREEDPGFFERLVQGQKPRFLWIGCSDSRVPAARVTGLQPGEIFVHRNIANLVNHGDLNVLSVVEYAVRILRVEHVIVCGHYGCGGVHTAMGDRSAGLLDNWLRHVMDVASEHSAELAAIPEGPERLNRLCELNAMRQVANLSRTTVVQEAWREGRSLSVHGWIYELANGLLKDLEVTTSGLHDLPAEYHVE